jgi:hypothetical protein
MCALPGAAARGHQPSHLDEVRALLRGLREENAVVGDDADGVAVQPPEARHLRVRDGHTDE